MFFYGVNGCFFILNTDWRINCGRTFFQHCQWIFKCEETNCRRNFFPFFLLQKSRFSPFFCFFFFVSSFFCFANENFPKIFLLKFDFLLFLVRKNGRYFSRRRFETKFGAEFESRIGSWIDQLKLHFVAIFIGIVVGDGSKGFDPMDEHFRRRIQIIERGRGRKTLGRPKK